MSDTTFIYALLDPETLSIRYIGKSSNPAGRLRQHIRDAFKERNYKANWIRSLLGIGMQPTLQIVDEVNVSEWQAAEAAYIEFYRSEGCAITNGSPGGEGWGSGKDHPSFGKPSHLRGKKRSPETIAKMSASERGKIISEETRAKLRQYKGEKHRGFRKPLSQKHRSKISAALIGHIGSNRGKIFSDDHRAKIGAAQKGEKNHWFGMSASEETKAKMRTSHRRRIERKWVALCVHELWN